jgi:hypothetical protein
MDRSARREAIRKAKTAREEIREAREHRQKGDCDEADKKYGDALGEDVD